MPIQQQDAFKLHRARLRRKELLEVAEPLLHSVHELLGEQPHLLAISDEQGLILRLMADPICRTLSLEGSNLFEGASWHEKAIGCNGIGTALATGRPVALVGPEHYQEAYTRSTCIGIPIHDTDGNVIGAADLSMPNEHVHLHTWGWMLSVAGSIEQQLSATSLRERTSTFPSNELAQPFAAVRGVIAFLGDTAGTEAQEQFGSVLKQVTIAEAQVTAMLEELRQERDDLERMNRNSDLVLGMLGHELRDPLAVLQNALDMIEAQPDDVNVMHWAHGLLKRQVGQVKRLMDDLLDMELVKHGKLLLKLQLVYLEEAVEQAVEAVVPLMEKKKQRLSRSVPPDLRVTADHARLVQVISNVLKNASTYSPEGAEISIQADRSADHRVVIRIEDNGKGMEAKEISRLFQPFIQGTKGDAKGLGLGLSIVDRIVRGHGGTIKAHSAGSGQGSTFCIELPVDPGVQDQEV